MFAATLFCRLVLTCSKHLLALLSPDLRLLRDRVFFLARERQNREGFRGRGFYSTRSSRLVLLVRASSRYALAGSLKKKKRTNCPKLFTSYAQSEHLRTLVPAYCENGNLRDQSIKSLLSQPVSRPLSFLSAETFLCSPGALRRNQTVPKALRCHVNGALLELHPMPRWHGMGGPPPWPRTHWIIAGARLCRLFRLFRTAYIVARAL